MDITYAPAKDGANIDKHGVSLTMATRIEWSDVLVMVDGRKDYGELREIGYAEINSRLYCVVFTQSGEMMHVISLRKANKREVARYEKS